MIDLLLTSLAILWPAFLIRRLYGDCRAAERANAALLADKNPRLEVWI